MSDYTLGDFAEDTKELRAQLTAALSENAALREALRKYGRHGAMCRENLRPVIKGRCDCGLATLLNEGEKKC